MCPHESYARRFPGIVPSNTKCGTQGGPSCAAGCEYATSSDGIHWTKPSLGLVSFNGSTENNIIVSANGTDPDVGFLLDTNDYMLMWMLIFMSICVIGVHGMLSGTASMDFGGAKNAGIAVGIIDGFVYLGTAVMSFWYGWRLPKGDAAADAANWAEWPLWMLPIALVGFLLATRVWNAKPKSSK